MDGHGHEDPRSLQDLIQTAQRIQAEVARIKDELSSKTAEGESGGGLVRCVVSGAGEVLSLSIDRAFPSLGPNSGRDPGRADSTENLKMLEDLVVGAVNVALARAREIAKQEMARVTGGLPLPPGMFGG
jgi:DNA-binding protein YbaB